MKPGDIAGHVDNQGYWRLCVDGERYGAQRLAWLYMKGDWPIGEVDHRDTNQLNNRWENLREASHHQNVANASKRKDNISGFKGVSWNSRHRRWVAQANVNGKRKWLGYFDDPKVAHQVYASAMVAQHGEFARIE